MTRPAAMTAAPKSPTPPPRGVGGSAADRSPARSAARRTPSGGAGEAAAEVEGARVASAAIPRRRHLPWYWRAVDALGAFVRESFPAFLALAFVVGMALLAVAQAFGGAR